MRSSAELTAAAVTGFLHSSLISTRLQVDAVDVVLRRVWSRLIHKHAHGTAIAAFYERSVSRHLYVALTSKVSPSESHSLEPGNPVAVNTSENNFVPLPGV